MENNNQTEKQKHFLKRVADLEKKIKEFELKLDELNARFDIVVKSLRR